MKAAIIIFLLIDCLNCFGQSSSNWNSDSMDLEFPYNKMQHGGHDWGLGLGVIYLYSKEKKEWEEICKLPFYGHDLRLHDEKSLLLTDQYNNDYIFDMETRQYQIRRPDFILQSFLTSPVTKISITRHWDGCRYQARVTVNFQKGMEGNLLSTTYSSEQEYDTRYSYPVSSHPAVNIKYPHIISKSDMECFLEGLNRDYKKRAEWKDFDITADEIALYRQKYSELMDQAQGRQIEIGLGGEVNRWYLEEGMLDSFAFNTDRILANLHDSLIDLAFKGDVWNSRVWFKIKIQNEAGLELNLNSVENEGALFNKAWHMPWAIELGNYKYSTSNLIITKFLLNHFPKKHMLPKDRLNVKLLLKLGYIKNKELSSKTVSHD